MLVTLDDDDDDGDDDDLMMMMSPGRYSVTDHGDVHLEDVTPDPPVSNVNRPKTIGGDMKRVSRFLVALLHVLYMLYS